MQEEALIFPQEIYSAHLMIINDIKLSKREIDIISCILNGRSAKGIAHFLSISPKTVESHTYNVMKKLDCSSRESLISIMEKSDKILILKRYYFNLLISLDFKKTLKDISKLKYKKEINCLIVCWKGEQKISFFNKLKGDLELAGVRTSFEVREQWKSLTCLVSEVSSEHYTVYVPPSKLITNKEKNKNIFQDDKRVSKLLHKTLFLSLEKEVFDQLSPSINAINCIFFTKEGYYFSIFEILERLISHERVKFLIQDFKKKNGPINSSSNIEPPVVTVDKEERLVYFNNFILQKKWFFLVIIIVCGIGLTAKIFETNLKAKEEVQNKSSEEKVETKVRSDLNLPKDTTLLNRFELMTQIDKKFENQEGIQIIALVGMGGAGKTTLARHYAHQQKADVIWEINAETHESLLKSFDSFAQALVKKEEDQKILREIRDTKNPTEKEERYIQFVKGHLKVHSNWLLIFDNVEKIADIQKYLPQDVMTWGQGKVLLTTQNSNIQNNRHVNSTVFVGELDPTQKLHLFTYIMNNEAIHTLSHQKNEEIKKFLENIPSFPLDVSIAAYYLKNSHCTYDQYLDHLKIYNQGFENIQEDLLKEAGDYTKTRYQIVTLSLHQLMKVHKDFKDLFLLISLVDSQNIPIDLLNAYKDKFIVDSFVNNLKKYSLVTSESSPSSFPNFSIHRSTQNIMFVYLTNSLNINKKNELTEELGVKLLRYLNNLINKDDLIWIKSGMSHFEKFLSHDTLLTNEMKTNIKSVLGCAYYCLSDYISANRLLEESLLSFDKSKTKNQAQRAQALAFLGVSYWELSDPLKARDLLEQSLFLYSTYLPENRIDLARVLSYLGVAYGSLGDYEKALKLLNEGLHIYNQSENPAKVAWILTHLGDIDRRLGDYEKAKKHFEQSLKIYKENFAYNHPGAAWAFTYLSIFYKELGYLNEAKDLLEKSLLIYDKHFSQNHLDVAWTTAYLGEVYGQLGQYEKAKDFLEKSLALYKKNKFEEDHVTIAWVYLRLGNVYKDTNDYVNARKCLEKSLISYEKNYGKNHLQVGKILRDLGEIYLLEKNLDSAEQCFHKASELYKKSQKPDKYMLLESLAKLYIVKSKDEHKKLNEKKSQDFKNQATVYLEEALKIVKAHFSSDSPHLTRIQSTLDNLKT